MSRKLESGKIMFSQIPKNPDGTFTQADINMASGRSVRPLPDDHPLSVAFNRNGHTHPKENEPFKDNTGSITHPPQEQNGLPRKMDPSRRISVASTHQKRSIEDEALTPGSDVNLELIAFINKHHGMDSNDFLRIHRPDEYRKLHEKPEPITIVTNPKLQIPTMHKVTRGARWLLQKDPIAFLRRLHVLTDPFTEGLRKKFAKKPASQEPAILEIARSMENRGHQQYPQYYVTPNGGRVREDQPYPNKILM